MTSVLYVDDERDLLEIAQLFLEKSGEFRVDVLTSAQEALELPSLQAYDVIISDYQMPGMDGITFLKTVREKFGDIPFILFTGRGREEIVIDAINNGADFYLRKGGDPRVQFAELSHKMRHALRRRQAELSLRKATTELQQIFRNMINAFVVWESVFDENGNYVSFRFGRFNDAYARIAKVNYEDVRGKDVFEIWPGTEKSWVDVYGRVAITGVPHVFDMYHEPTKGYYHCNAYRPTDSPAQVCVIFEDITKRRQAESELHAAYETPATEEDLKSQYEALSHHESRLRESEEKYRLLADNVQDVIWTADLEMRLTYISPSIQALRGVSQDEAMAESLSDILTPESFRILTGNRREGLEAIQKEGAVPLNQVMELEFRRRDGTTVWTETMITPTVDRTRTLLGVTGVTRDVTGRRKAEDALRLANRQLNLLGSITRHDLLNKLTVILGNLKLAEKRCTDPALAENLKKIQSATSAIKSQIEFTRIYQKLGTHEPQWSGLDTVIPHSHVPPGITLNIAVQGIQVLADPMLEKVFFNLLDNSVRHGNRVTEIRISSRQEGTDLVIVWEDNGKGIAAEEKEKIFGQGFGENTGLGMFLVREILSLTGITITENGEPGRGARFEILVPEGNYRYSPP